jgi:hypothetical protein
MSNLRAIASVVLLTFVPLQAWSANDPDHPLIARALDQVVREWNANRTFDGIHEKIKSRLSAEDEKQLQELAPELRKQKLPAIRRSGDQLVVMRERGGFDRDLKLHVEKAYPVLLNLNGATIEIPFIGTLPPISPKVREALQTKHAALDWLIPSAQAQEPVSTMAAVVVLGVMLTLIAGLSMVYAATSHAEKKLENLTKDCEGLRAKLNSATGKATAGQLNAVSEGYRRVTELGRSRAYNCGLADENNDQPFCVKLKTFDTCFTSLESQVQRLPGNNQRKAKPGDDATQGPGGPPGPRPKTVINGG